MKKITDILSANRVKINTLFFLCAVVCPRMELWWWGAGLIITVVGLCIRLWAGGFIHKDEEVTRRGPYSMIRHPLYLGNFLIFLGVGLGGRHLILMAIFLPFFLLTHAAAIKKEEKFLLEKFGMEYLDYRNTTPAFIPRRLVWDFKGWSWRMAMKNTSPYFMGAVAAYFFLVWCGSGLCQIFDIFSHF